MRLYNAGSCTPWAAKAAKSPPRNFLPKQSSTGFDVWKSSKDQTHPSAKQSFNMGVLPSQRTPTEASRNCKAPPGPSESSSPHTASYTANLTPEISPPAHSNTRFSPTKTMAEKELFETLPALRDLDDLLMRVSLLASGEAEDKSEESSLTTLSTLSTKGSIDKLSSPHEFVFGCEDIPETLVEKCLANSPFSRNGKSRWPSTKSPRMQGHVELPWPAEHIQDDILGLNDRSPTKLFGEEFEPQNEETYGDIRAGLRKVETKFSPSKKAKIPDFPTQQANQGRNEVYSQEPFRRSMSPNMIKNLHPFESISKDTTPIMFDSALSLTRHLKITIQDNTRDSPLDLSQTPEVSNLRGVWPESDDGSTPGQTKKVLFRMPDGPSTFPLDPVQVPSPESDEKRVVQPSIEDDPKYAKYFRMIKMGLPMGAVKNALKMDGHDPSVLDGDTTIPAEKQRPRDSPIQAPGEKIRHFRIHWETHNEIRSNSVWAMVKRDPDVSNIEVDEQEVKKLFRCDTLSQHKPSNPSSRTNEHAAVKVIDSKRANNGGITLARVRLTYNEIARAVDNFDQDAITAEQIRGIINFIPTQDERSALRSYLDKPGHSRTTLCECEKFMVAMMSVKHAKRKLSAIQFMQSFASCLEDLRRDARLVQKACEEIMSSSRFRKILGMILTLGNQLNTAGAKGKEPAGAISLASLLKLDQAKAFDRQTTFLHFVVTNIRRNKGSLIHYKDELPSVFKVEKMQWSLVMSEMQRMEKGIDEVRKIALHYSQIQAGLAADDAMTLTSSNMPLSREVELLQTTSVGRFTLDACLRMAVLVNEVEKAKDMCDSLFQYFGEQQKTQSQPDLVFHTVCTFSRNFDRALDEVIIQEKAKVREMRGVPIVRCATKSFDDGEGGGIEKAMLQALRNKHSGASGSTVLSDRKRTSIKAKGKFRWRRRKF